jgi:hypothetical protein
LLVSRAAAVLFATLVCFLLQTVPLHASINVVSYWRLGENDPGAADGVAATNTIDSVGTNNLTFTGTAQYSSNVDARAASHAGSTLSVNFTNGAYATNVFVSTNLDNFGIECWVKPTALGGGQVIAYNGSTGGIGDGGWGIILGADNNYYGLFGGVTTLGGMPATANVWWHLALVRASGTATLYVNGFAIGATTTATPGLATVGGFALGAPPQSPTSQFFTGQIDEVRMFTFGAGQFSTNDLLFNQSFTLSTTNAVESSGAGAGIVILAASPSTLAWTNTANASWLHLDAADSSGTGTRYVYYTFDANPGATRVGTLTIAGQTYTVTQAGTNYTQTTQPVSCFNLAPAGMVVDPSGIVYASSGSSVYKWTPGTTNPVALITSGLSTPQGLALDTAGNLYVANSGGTSISKWIAASSTLTSLFTTLSNAHPNHVGVDSTGNVYFISDFSEQGPIKWSAADGSQARAMPDIPVSSAEQQLSLAVDAASTVYSMIEVSNPKDPPGNSGVEKRPVGGPTGNVPGTFRSFDISHPRAVAVDGEGNVYFTEISANSMNKYSLAFNNVTVLGGQGPTVIAADAARNYYFFSGSVQKIPYAFVDSTAQSVPILGGNGQLPPVLPLNADIAGPLSPTADQSWITVTGVTNGVVYYSVAANTNLARSGNIFVLGKAIPVQQDGVPLIPPFLANPTSTNGTFGFMFTNTQTTNFSVLYSTNLMTPLSNWLPLGAPSNISAGVFQFTAPNTNDPQGFYRVSSP